MTDSYLLPVALLLGVHTDEIEEIEPVAWRVKVVKHQAGIETIEYRKIELS